MSLELDCHHVYPSGFSLQVRLRGGDGVTALVGPSGAGKSSVLHMIAGVLHPRVGRITLNEQVLLDTAAGIRLPPEDRGLGVVFQDLRLLPHLSVRDNLLYGRRRRPCREVEPDRVVTMLELSDVLDRSIHTLSGGQKQRVALGRAVLRGPRMLLMDEPLTALDQDLKHRVVDYLEAVFEAWRIPILLVSHDRRDVERLAQTVIVMNEGKVVEG